MSMWKGMTDERIRMNRLIGLIDTRMKVIQSNTSIVRELRPFKDQLLWIANEYKAWLLFYCIFLLYFSFQKV